MSSVTIRIPMITSTGPSQPREQMSREFQGSLPSHDAIALVASIVREGLETAQYPDYQGLNALADEYLVQEVALVTAVPNDVWIRNGLTPLSDWQLASPQ